MKRGFGHFRNAYIIINRRSVFTYTKLDWSFLRCTWTRLLNFAIISDNPIIVFLIVNNFYPYTLRKLLL